MKNSTHPLNEIIQLKFMRMKENVHSLGKLILKPNEFTDYADPFGLFEQDIEPKTFLTVEDWTSSESIMLDGDGLKYPGGSGRRLPKFEVNIELSDKLSTFERSKYTLL